MWYKLISAGALLTLSIPLAAQSQSGNSALLTDVTKCQGVADSVQRLACFDASVAKLRVAAERRDIVVIDKEEVAKTRRSLFGFTLPDTPFFRGSSPKEYEQFEQVETTVTGVTPSGRGNWIMALGNGSTWQFAETSRTSEPRTGHKVVIKAAAFGSYLANVDGQRAVRVRRIR